MFLSGVFGVPPRPSAKRVGGERGFASLLSSTKASSSPTEPHSNTSGQARWGVGHGGASDMTVLEQRPRKPYCYDETIVRTAAHAQLACGRICSPGLFQVVCSALSICPFLDTPLSSTSLVSKAQTRPSAGFGRGTGRPTNPHLNPSHVVSTQNAIAAGHLQ